MVVFSVQLSALARQTIAPLHKVQCVRSTNEKMTSHTNYTIIPTNDLYILTINIIIL